MKKIILILVIFMGFIENVNSLNLDTNEIYAMDMKSGRVFYEKNSNEKRLIASTTKIMTAIIAIENTDLSNIFEVGEEVLKAYGSNVYLSYHEHMLVTDLLYGLMLRSGNDCAIVLANHVTNYDKFILLMNNKVKQLGLVDTLFNNPTGLDDYEENVSTAHDLAFIYKYAYQNEIFRTIVGTKNYKTSSDQKSYNWNNRNTLLSTYKYATGGKTGYTPKAGRVLVTSASKNNLDIVIVSFNDIYDYNLHKQIYDDVFSDYQNILLLDKNNFNVDSSYDGTLYINSSFSYPLTENEESLIKRKIVFNDKRGYKDGDKVGDIYIYLDDDIIFNTDIFIKTKKESFFFNIKKFFSDLF